MTDRTSNSLLSKALTAGALALATTLGPGDGHAQPAAPSVAVQARNKEVVRRWSEELWGRGMADVADQIVSPDYVRHDPGDPFPARGPADVKRIVRMLRGMLPDLSIEIDAMVAEGDVVVCRYTATATDTVGYMGMAPTGKKIRTAAMQMFRLVDGRIVESWAVRDDLGVLRQLGHYPPPSVAPRL